MNTKDIGALALTSRYFYGILRDSGKIYDHYISALKFDKKMNQLIDSFFSKNIQVLIERPGLLALEKQKRLVEYIIGNSDEPVRFHALYDVAKNLKNLHKDLCKDLFEGRLNIPDRTERNSYLIVLAEQIEHIDRDLHLDLLKDIDGMNDVKERSEALSVLAEHPEHLDQGLHRDLFAAINRTQNAERRFLLQVSLWKGSPYLDKNLHEDLLDMVIGIHDAYSRFELLYNPGLNFKNLNENLHEKLIKLVSDSNPRINELVKMVVLTKLAPSLKYLRKDLQEEFIRLLQVSVNLDHFHPSNMAGMLEGFLEGLEGMKKPILDGGAI